MQHNAPYKLVTLRDGAQSIHSIAHGETMHPAVGPAAEADALYVRQLRIVERATQCRGEFVIWDIGLGGAANAIAVLRATRNLDRPLRLISFDYTIEPLRFALQHRAELGYLDDWTSPVEQLIEQHHTEINRPGQRLRWELRLADFPSLLASTAAASLPKPHAIFFDAYSPAKNPSMWTLPLFTHLHQLLDPASPCSLSTYSRSTLVRAALLLAGFFVGVGHPMGTKEETTVAANALELIAEPLTRDWLERTRRSRSAEPLREPEYRQSPISQETWNQLQLHPQFRMV